MEENKDQNEQINDRNYKQEKKIKKVNFLSIRKNHQFIFLFPLRQDYSLVGHHVARQWKRNPSLRRISAVWEVVKKIKKNLEGKENSQLVAGKDPRIAWPEETTQ